MWYTMAVRVLALALAGLAGLFASSAPAASPTGLVIDPALSSRAAFVAEKTVSVYCAATTDAWQAFITSSGDVPPDGITNGITPIVGGSTTYLSPDTCGALHARLHKQPVNLLVLGASLDVLTVEALHLKGDGSDGQTACDALRVLPGFLYRVWSFKNHSAGLATALRGAREYHAAQSAQYHTGTCG